MGISQKIKKIFPDKGLPSSNIDLEDTKRGQLVQQSSAFPSGQFMRKSFTGSRETMSAAKVAFKGHFPGNIDRGSKT
jgi:hypothetical protein